MYRAAERLGAPLRIAAAAQDPVISRPGEVKVASGQRVPPSFRGQGASLAQCQPVTQPATPHLLAGMVQRLYWGA